MTEELWFGPIMSARLLDFVADGALTDRKLRLFAVGLSRVLESWASEQFLLDATQQAEKVADDLIQASAIEPTRQMLLEKRREYLRTECQMEERDAMIRGALFRLPKESREWIGKWDVVHGGLHIEAKRAAQLAIRSAIRVVRSLHLPHLQSAVTGSIVRDIFGNPFRPVTIDPRWLTATVIDLADAIYADRAFDRMPILADALMDAGCDSEEIIAHCRGDAPHVRGCWAVDLVLGKE